jgi:predicted O-methyltransferase YrrM
MAATARERLELVLGDAEVSRFYPAAYGRAIWDSVRSLRPRKMIEFGVHRGYSAIIAALAMEENGSGSLGAYDWWEDGRRDGVDEAGLALRHFDRYGVGSRISLRELDFFAWIRAPEPCDLLYVDIDNDGDKIRSLYEGLRPQIEAGLVVLFEGGSEERDRHPVMTGRKPMGAVRTFTGYEIVLDVFPSLSRISAGAPAAPGSR